MSYETAIATIRARLPGVIAVYLFGSRASGEPHARSDVDLAVLLPRRLDPLHRWKLQEDLAALLHAPVDLVDLRSASTVLRAQVVDRGKLLFESDASARMAFEAVVLSDYARLNEERKEILADIKRRGTIHG